MVVDEQQSSIDSTERAWQFAVFPDSLLPLVLQVLSLASRVKEDGEGSASRTKKFGDIVRYLVVFFLAPQPFVSSCFI